MTRISALTQYPIHDTLTEDVKYLADQTLNSLFQSESNRFEQYTVEAAGLFLDFSKNAYEKTQIEVEKSVVNAYGSAKMAEALVSSLTTTTRPLKNHMTSSKLSMRTD